MGSLNSDGSKISQSRKTLRNLGGAYTHSSERVENDSSRDKTPEDASDELGTTPSLSASQYSSTSTSSIVKITRSDNDSVISREKEVVIESPVGAGPPWPISAVGAAGGDLSGTYPNPSVVGLRGTAISASAPSVGQALVYNGTVYIPSGVSSSSSYNTLVASRTTNVASSTAGEKAHTIIVPANTLAASGDFLEWELWGNAEGTVNLTVQIEIGVSEYINFGTLNSTASWHYSGRMYRRTQNIQTTRYVKEVNTTFQTITDIPHTFDLSASQTWAVSIATRTDGTVNFHGFNISVVKSS